MWGGQELSASTPKPCFTAIIYNSVKYKMFLIYKGVGDVTLRCLLGEGGHQYKSLRTTDLLKLAKQLLVYAYSFSKIAASEDKLYKVVKRINFNPPAENTSSQ